MSKFMFGATEVSCETCGDAVRPQNAVWRSHRPYCSAAHEHADQP